MVRVGKRARTWLLAIKAEEGQEVSSFRESSVNTLPAQVTLTDFGKQNQCRCKHCTKGLSCSSLKAFVCPLLTLLLIDVYHNYLNQAL